MTSRQDVLFYVFTAFFVLIGLVSLSVLLGFPSSVDKKFRDWATRGFVAGITTAVFGLFKVFLASPATPFMVTLLMPAGMVEPIMLTSGTYEYREVEPGKPKPTKRTGPIVPVLGEGSWQVQLPREVSDHPTVLLFEDEKGNAYQAGPFYPNYVRQQIRTGTRVVSETTGSWAVPGVALVSAAEAGSPSAGRETTAAARFNNYARQLPGGYQRPFYQWRVFVDEPPAVLETISQVDYVLHPTFPEPFKVSRDRQKQFELIATGWGEFTIVITVHYTDGRTAETTYGLNLRREWPPEPQPRSVAPTRSRRGSV